MGISVAQSVNAGNERSGGIRTRLNIWRTRNQPAAEKKDIDFCPGHYQHGIVSQASVWRFDRIVSRCEQLENEVE